MERGAILRNTAMCGPRRSRPVGPLTRTATGFGSIHGDGLGLSMSRGATLHSTMDDGFMPAVSGDGRRDRFTPGRIMLPR